MAKLTVLPNQDIIDGFRGKIDFYIHHQSCDRSVSGPGIPCARKWPRKADPRGIPEVEAHWAAFSYAAGLWSLLSPVVQAAYNSQSTDSGLSGRDLMTRGFLSGIYTYAH